MVCKVTEADYGGVYCGMDNTIEDQVKNWRSEIALICKLSGRFGYRRSGRTVVQQAEFEGRRNRLVEIVQQLAVLASRKSAMNLLGPKGLLIVASANQK
jgi:hypothetical protein